MLSKLPDYSGVITWKDIGSKQENISKIIEDEIAKEVVESKDPNYYIIHNGETVIIKNNNKTWKVVVDSDGKVKFVKFTQIESSQPNDPKKRNEEKKKIEIEPLLFALVFEFLSKKKDFLSVAMLNKEINEYLFYGTLRGNLIQIKNPEYFKNIEFLIDYRNNVNIPNTNIIYRLTLVNKFTTNNALVNILKQIPNLTSLDISNCINLTGESIRYIAQKMKKLEEIHFFKDFELLNANDFQLLNNLPSLHKIYLIDCVNITNEMLQQLTHINVLEITNCYTITQNAILRRDDENRMLGMIYLEELNISGCNNINLTALLDLINENEFRKILYNQQNPYNPVKKLKRFVLQRYIPNVLVINQNARWDALKDVKIVDFSFTNINDFMLSALVGVKQLNITNCERITSNVFQYLPNLEDLDISIIGTRVTNIDDNAFQYFGNLRYLTMKGNTKIIGTGFDKIPKLLNGSPKLISLDAENCIISDKHISCLKNLEMLNLNNCKNVNTKIIQGVKYAVNTLFENIKDFKNLLFLDLDNCFITDETFKVAGFKNLPIKELSIRYTQITRETIKLLPPTIRNLFLDGIEFFKKYSKEINKENIFRKLFQDLEDSIEVLSIPGTNIDLTCLLDEDFLKNKDKKVKKEKKEKKEKKVKKEKKEKNEEEIIIKEESDETKKKIKKKREMFFQKLNTLSISKSQRDKDPKVSKIILENVQDVIVLKNRAEYIESQKKKMLKKLNKLDNDIAICKLSISKIENDNEQLLKVQEDNIRKDSKDEILKDVKDELLSEFYEKKYPMYAYDKIDPNIIELEKKEKKDVKKYIEEAEKYLKTKEAEKKIKDRVEEVIRNRAINEINTYELITKETMAKLLEFRIILRQLEDDKNDLLDELNKLK